MELPSNFQGTILELYKEILLEVKLLSDKFNDINLIRIIEDFITIDYTKLLLEENINMYGEHLEQLSIITGVKLKQMLTDNPIIQHYLINTLENSSRGVSKRLGYLEPYHRIQYLSQQHNEKIYKQLVNSQSELKEWLKQLDIQGVNVLKFIQASNQKLTS